MHRIVHPREDSPKFPRNLMLGPGSARFPLAGRVCLWVILTGLLPASPGAAQGTAGAAAAPAPGTAAGATETTDRAAAFSKVLDKQFSAASMNKWHVPGAVLVAVQDGAVTVVREYGFADLDGKKPVRAGRTIFRAGSVSKCFTAAAVMQLCEQGRAGLDEDVNRYLRRVRVPATYPAPVTLRHLLTHTAGFAEYIHGQHRREGSEWLPLEEYLARRLPPRIMPPGEFFSYNDHGYSLAGLVVQDVSGLPYEEYMERNVLRPLGMARSSFRQPLPDALRGDLAAGYMFRDGRYVRYSPDRCETVPAACLSSTADDMARFMIAMLGDGRCGEARILSADGVYELRRRAFGHHPALRGRTLGFSELFADGSGVIFHDGGMPGFNSRLVLAPRERCGFYLAWNSDTLAPKYALTEAWADIFTPGAGKPPAAAPPASAAHDLERFAGSYAELDGLSTTCLKIGGVMENAVTVEACPAGTLRAFGSEFRPVAPLLFRDADGYPIAFRAGGGEDVTYLFAGTAAFRKMRFWETPGFLLGLCILFFLVCLPMGLLWSGSGLFLRKKLAPFWRRTFPPGSRLAGLVSVLIVLFLACFLGLFLQMDHYWQIMRNEFPWSWMTKLLILPLIISALALALPVYAILAWVRKGGTLFGRCCLSLVVLTTALFVWTMAAWNMLGFRY